MITGQSTYNTKHFFFKIMDHSVLNTKWFKIRKKMKEKKLLNRPVITALRFVFHSDWPMLCEVSKKTGPGVLVGRENFPFPSGYRCSKKRRVV